MNVVIILPVDFGIIDLKVSAVMLDQHGPNIVFKRDTDPQKVIEFIEENFDLTAKTGGYIPKG